MAEKENKTKSLASKLASVMGKIGYVEKSGFNNFHKYAFATESDVQDAVQKKLAEVNVIMVPNMIESSYRETKTARGNTEFIYKVSMEYTFHDGDSDDIITFRMDGEGQDGGDKGIYKAISGAQKYAIMKFFLIPTGDDPELENGNEKAPSKKTAAPKKNYSDTKKSPPAKTNTNKADEDKQFFEKRDAIKNRVAMYSKKKGTKQDTVTQYLITKANEIKNTNYKTVCSNNMNTINEILGQLEQKLAEAMGQTGDPGPEPDPEQPELLDRFTNQPTQ